MDTAKKRAKVELPTPVSQCTIAIIPHATPVWLLIVLLQIRPLLCCCSGHFRSPQNTQIYGVFLTSIRCLVLRPLEVIMSKPLPGAHGSGLEAIRHSVVSP